MESATGKKQRLKYLPPVPIQMVDNEVEVGEEVVSEQGYNGKMSSLKTWALDVRIGDCTIVTGSGAGQKFAVWSVSVETTKGGHMHMFKRYSEFVTLRNNLVTSFPDHVTEIPKLPPKKVFGNLQNDFLVKRRRGLEFFISCVLLNPILANSDVVKKFVSESAK